MTFFCRYGEFVAFVLHGVFEYTFRRRPRPFPLRTVIEVEFAGIRAEGLAEGLVEKLGEEGAREVIEERYAHVRKQLDARQLQLMEIFEEDPVLLARFLARMSRR